MGRLEGDRNQVSTPYDAERLEQDKPGETLLDVGEHECVTCPRCACTFAKVHPACPRCSVEAQLVQVERKSSDAINEHLRLRIATIEERDNLAHVWEQSRKTVESQAKRITELESKNERLIELLKELKAYEYPVGPKSHPTRKGFRLWTKVDKEIDSK